MFVYARSFLVCLSFVLLSGCVVVTEQPAGGEVLRSKGKGLGGTWVGSNEVFYIDARDALKGEVEIFIVSGSNKRNYALKSATGLLRRGSGRIFLNLKLSDVGQGQVDPLIHNSWYPFIVEKEGDVIRLYIPDYNKLIKEDPSAHERFEKFDANYLLKGTSEEIAEVLVNDLPLVLFDELKRLPNRIESIGVKETTDLHQYESLVSESSSTVIGHFPQSIENEPSRYKLSHQPGFLQGGGHFHLEEQLDSEKVLELHQQMMDEALAYRDVGKPTIISLKTELDPDTPRVSYHTSDTQFSLPKGFRIFYLHAKPYRDEGFKWNHGSIAGIAINTDNCRAIYFVESW